MPSPPSPAAWAWEPAGIKVHWWLSTYTALVPRFTTSCRPVALP